MLGTGCLHALSKTEVNLLYQIFFPILRAELVPTCQFVSLAISCIELRITYAAPSLIIHAESPIYVGESLGYLGVEFNADFVFKFILLIKPVVLQFIVVPLEVFEYLDGFICTAAQQVSNLSNFLHLALLDLLHRIYHEVILSNI